MRVPYGMAIGSGAANFDASATTIKPCSAPAVREAKEKRETDAMLGNASPRKPKLKTCSKSSKLLILLVACRVKASSNSSAAMPAPLSLMRIRRAPPPSISISIRLAPASKLFSSNSLTTDAGRSTTSPAAIWLISTSGKRLIGTNEALVSCCMVARKNRVQLRDPASDSKRRRKTGLKRISRQGVGVRRI